jgi:hypothetical protein
MKENRPSICPLQTMTLRICAFNFLWASFLHSDEHKAQVVWPLSICPFQTMTLRICALTFLWPSFLHSEHKPQLCFNLFVGEGSTKMLKFLLAVS